MVDICKVTANDNYELLLEFENGNTVSISFANRLNTVRFGRLSDISFFKKVKTDGVLVKWGTEIEITLEELLDMLKSKKHR